MTHIVLSLILIFELLFFLGCNSGQQRKTTAVGREKITISASRDATGEEGEDENSEDSADAQASSKSEDSDDDSDDSKGSHTSNDSEDLNETDSDATDLSNGKNSDDDGVETGDNPQSPPTESETFFTVGGTITNLKGTGLKLIINNAKTIILEKEVTEFSFDEMKFKDGETYEVAINEQPKEPDQICSITMGKGTIESSDVRNLAITCADSGNTVSVAVQGLTEGESLKLSLNGTEEITVTKDGEVKFEQKIAKDTDYEVLVSEHPQSGSCSVANGKNKMAEIDVIVQVSCKAGGELKVGLTVAGLAGNGLGLSLNNIYLLQPDKDGEFFFPAVLKTGDPYIIKLISQPTGAPEPLTCVIEGETEGKVSDQNIMRTIKCEKTPLQITYSLSEVFHAQRNNVVGFEDKPIISGDKTFCSLQKVAFQDVDAWSEWALCETRLTNNHWYIKAELGLGPDADAWCSSQCLKWTDGTFTVTTSEQAAKNNVNGVATKEIATTQNTVCGLSYVAFEDTDSYSESAECKTEVDPTLNKWVVRATLNKNDDSDAWCKASCLTWPEGAKITVKEQVHASQNNSKGNKDTPLAEANNHFCFLTKVAFEDIDSEGESAQCRVFKENGFWILQAQLNKEDDSDAWCSAMCIKWQ